MTKPMTLTRRIADAVVMAGISAALLVNVQVMALPVHFV